jgi:hypothetical protein
LELQGCDILVLVIMTIIIEGGIVIDVEVFFGYFGH